MESAQLKKGKRYEHMNAKQPRSIRQLAKSTGYSVGEVQRRRTRGESDVSIKRAAKSRDAQRDGKASTSQGETYPEAQARKESALADLREMEAAERRGDLLDAEETHQAWAAMVMAFRAKALVIGEELADRLAVAAGDPVKCRELIDDKVYQALTELSQYPKKSAA